MLDEGFRQLIKSAVREALAEAGALPPNAAQTPSATERAVYSKREFAQRHACSQRSVDYWIASGAVKVVRHGYRVFIPVSESARLTVEGLPPVRGSRPAAE